MNFKLPKNKTIRWIIYIVSAGIALWLWPFALGGVLGWLAFTKIKDPKLNTLKYLTVAGIAGISLFTGSAWVAGLSSSAPSEEKVAPPPTTITKIDEPVKVAETEPQLYMVTKVVDGDTIDVDFNGKTERIRMIGIDTPETVDPRTTVQCFGKEASDKMKSLVEGKSVTLESDLVSGDRDKYNRLLRFPFLEDGTNVGKTMISEGYAHEYTYESQAYKYQTEFKEAEKRARDGKKGLWSPDTCNGTTEKIEPKKEEPKVTPAPVVEPKATTPTPAPTAPSGSGVVKKSSTNICHAPGTTYYEKTKNFTPYNSIDECLDSGGRLPKR